MPLLLLVGLCAIPVVTLTLLSQTIGTKVVVPRWTLCGCCCCYCEPLFERRLLAIGSQSAALSLSSIRLLCAVVLSFFRFVQFLV